MSAPLDAMTRTGTASETGGPTGRLHQKLRRACHEMEAAFLRQLFEAMRETADQEEGLFGSSEGEQIFTQLMDDRLASEAADHMSRGLGEALYRQLVTHLDGEG